MRTYQDSILSLLHQAVVTFHRELVEACNPL